MVQQLFLILLIAMENICVNCYVTEKFINAFYSGAMPIYLGSANINDLFNINEFINVNDFNTFKDCVDFVINMDDSKIKQMLEEPIYNENNELINLLNDEYNNKNENKILKSYLQILKTFLI